MPSDEVSVTDCPLPEEAPGTYEAIAAAQGICFLYPDTYNAFEGQDGTITLYVRSMLNNHVPLASIGVTPSEGQTLEALAARRLADYAWPDTQPEAITLGGEAAGTDPAQRPSLHVNIRSRWSVRRRDECRCSVCTTW